MARIQYQPATKTKGFRPIEITTAGISRMREETNRVVRGMEKNLAAEQRQRQENLKAMQDNAAYTEQAMRRNREIELQNLKSEELSIKQTAQRDQQQAQYDANATETILSSISDFSESAAKLVAANKAAQLKGQMEAVAASDTNPYAAELAAEAYETSFNLAAIAGTKETANIIANDALAGNPLSDTYKSLVAENGVGAVGRRALLNKVAVDTFGILSKKAFSNTEQIFSHNGVPFSGVEALRDPEKTRIVHAEISKNISQLFLSKHGISEQQYLNPAKIEIQKLKKLQEDRSETKSVAFNLEIGLQKANDVALAGTTNAYTAGYSLVQKLSGFKGGHNFMSNQIKVAKNQEQVNAIGNVITDDGRLYKDRFPNIFDPAVQSREDAINARNRENKRVYNETLDNNLFEARAQLLPLLNETPHETHAQIIKEYSAAGATPPSWWSQAYKSAVTGANERFAEELAMLQRAGGIVPEKRINGEPNDANREKLNALRNAQIEQQYGGQAGLDQLKGLEAIARKRTNIAVNGGRNSPITFTLLAGMEKRWKEHFATTQDVVKATELLEKDLFEADEGKNKTALFAAEYDNDGNALSFPNLSPTDKDTDQRINLIQTKLLANKTLGDIVSMPGMLGKPSDLAKISIESETSNKIKYTRETMYLAAKFGKKPSEIHNAQVTANNKTFGTNDPLIKSTIKSEAIDNASPDNAKLMNSIFRAQNTRGYANHTGTVNRHMRFTFSGNGVAPIQQTNALIEVAGQLGVSPVDLATIIGFETGGTYDPGIVGGEGNKYEGLIQFGEPERAAYGVVPGMSFEDQLRGPVRRFFEDRFARAGMSTQGATLEDLYTTVIAGNPGANRDAQDSFGTSARSGVAKMGPHREAAMKRFGFQ